MVCLPVADAPQARLVADDHAPFARQRTGIETAALDHVLDPDRLVVDRSDDQTADVADAAQLLHAQNIGSAASGALIDGTDVLAFFFTEGHGHLPSCQPIKKSKHRRQAPMFWIRLVHELLAQTSPDACFLLG